MSWNPEVNAIRHLGKIDWHKRGRKVNAAEAKLSVRYCDGPRLSIDLKPMSGCVEVAVTFGVWNGRHTDYAAFGAGIDNLLGYGIAGIAPLARFADRWHLNAMKTGTRQQALLISANENVSKWPYRPIGAKLEGAGAFQWYARNCTFLKHVGLYVDRGYTFGSQWLCEPIADEALTWVLDWFKVPDDKRALVAQWREMERAPIVEEDGPRNAREVLAPSPAPRPSGEVMPRTAWDEIL